MGNLHVSVKKFHNLFVKYHEYDPLMCLVLLWGDKIVTNVNSNCFQVLSFCRFQFKNKEITNSGLHGLSYTWWVAKEYCAGVDFTLSVHCDVGVKKVLKIQEFVVLYGCHGVSLWIVILQPYLTQ